MPVSGHHCRRIGRQQVARSSQYLKHKHILPWLPSHDPAKNLPKLANPILSTRYFSARGSIRFRINWLKSSLSLSLPFSRFLDELDPRNGRKCKCFRGNMEGEIREIWWKHCLGENFSSILFRGRGGRVIARARSMPEDPNNSSSRSYFSHQNRARIVQIYEGWYWSGPGWAVYNSSFQHHLLPRTSIEQRDLRINLCKFVPTLRVKGRP